MDTNKRCFKCGVGKPLGEFYSHKRMADGHLNKCKDCTKNDVACNLAIRLQDTGFVLCERQRNRDKSARARMNGSACSSSPESSAKWSRLNPHKKAANRAVRKALQSGRLIKQPCIVCGNAKSHGHHEDYTRQLSVHWLCSKHHGERHVKINECNLLMIPVPSIEEQFNLAPD